MCSENIHSSGPCNADVWAATYLRISCSDGSISDIQINRNANYTTNSTTCPQDEGDVGVLPDSEPPCKNLKKLTDNPTNIASRFNELKNDSGNFEKGFRLEKVMNSLNSQAGDMETASNTHSVTITGEALTFAIAHNHPNEDDFYSFQARIF